MTSLGSRLTIWYVLMITGTVAIVLLMGRTLLEIELIRGIDLLNAAQFQEIENRVEDDHLISPEDEFLKEVSDHSKIDAPLYLFQVRDQHGTVLFRSANMGRTIFPVDSGKQSRSTYAIDELGEVRISTFAAGNYQVQIATSLLPTQQLYHDYYGVSALVLAVVVTLSYFFGHRMSRLALDPIQGIQQTASRISAENLKERIPVSQIKDEISDLTALLNQMFDRLEKAFARLSRFAGEASHELKTPLSIIRLQSEKLLLHGNLSSVQQEAMQQQLKSIHGLNLVIEKLLFIARAESGAIQAKQKLQSTASFIETFVEDALVLCEDASIEFELTQNDELSVSFDESLIRQVLLNLLSNALKVTPAKGKITLASTADKSTWKVTVEDTGPGLSDAVSSEEMFKPFVRLDPELNWSFAKGAGLGLAICHSILDLHHGRIYVENRKAEKGLRVIFELPSAKRSQ
jgi:signal transduction histidine kinase